MNGNSYQHPAEQTVKAIDHVRTEFAKTRGTTRNAVDQLFAGNTYDDYPPFRDQFKDVCMTKGSYPEAYLDDLQEIYQATRGQSTKSVGEAFLEKLPKAHAVIETCTRALADGHLDKDECLELIPLLTSMECAVEQLKQAVFARKNELAGVRDFAHKAVNGRRA